MLRALPPSSALRALLCAAVLVTITPTIRAEDLAALQRKIQTAVEKVLPTVVAVRGPLPEDPKLKGQPVGYGSGVIVSEDGVILSQYHVSHQGVNRRGNIPPAGTKTLIVFADGKEAEAELLGADLFNDLSLLRLTKPGNYPYAAMEGPAAKLGDAVLKLGHPLSYRAGRTPPVRLSRVVAATERFFATDCPITGGDSGGPFFDLDGRLVGIIRNGQIPESVIHESGQARMRIVMPMSVTPTAVISAGFEAMRAGKSIGSLDIRTAAAQEFDAAMRTAKALPADRWSQGATTRAACASMTSKARNSVVTILVGEEAAALGTVVADGYILTKASEMLPTARCRLPDGTIVAATIAGVDSTYDLALLRAKTDGLTPVAWAEKEPPLGSLLAAPGTDALPLAVGVLGVKSRDLNTPAPPTVRRPPPTAAPPEVLGSAIEGRGYWVEFVDGAAEAAGIRPGDMILSIAGASIRSHADVVASAEGRQAGERASVSMLRGGKPLEITLTFVRNRRYGMSARNDGFPTVFEHDLPLIATECGGPVVGLDGRAVGITIARVNVHGCMAIPAGHIRRLIPDLQAGKPLAALPPAPKAATPRMAAKAAQTPEAKPVNVDVAAIERHLKERRDRLQHLSVEFDSTAEPVLDPYMLASWGINLRRDYRERYRFAFSGDKRLCEKTEPNVLAYWVPQHRVVPAKDAPPEVVRRVEEARRVDESNRVATGVSALFLVLGNAQTIRQTRTIHDGKDVYLKMPLSGKATRVDASFFLAPAGYLENLGLRPLDPHIRPDGRQYQEPYFFPVNFTRYKDCRVRPLTETVDDAACVVIDATYKGTEQGKDTHFIEKLWLDPTLGYAPRQWELWADGNLRWRRSNTQFEEFAPGVWLPWEAAIAYGTPVWVAAEYRNQPAYRTVLRLRHAIVNAAKDEWFQP